MHVLVGNISFVCFCGRRQTVHAIFTHHDWVAYLLVCARNPMPHFAVAWFYKSQPQDTTKDILRSDCEKAFVFFHHFFLAKKKTHTGHSLFPFLEDFETFMCEKRMYFLDPVDIMLLRTVLNTISTAANALLLAGTLFHKKWIKLERDAAATEEWMGGCSNL